jgi:hypothetical protein
MRYPALSPILLATLALAAPVFADGPCEGRYLTGTPLAGADNDVYAILPATTPQGNKLFLGGRFMVIGNKVSPCAAAWNGTTWEDMGAILESDDNIPGFSCFAYINNTLYAAGEFTTVNGQAASHMARWNGTAWVPWTVGITGFQPRIRAMHIHNGELYIGGDFDSIGGVAIHNLAKWTGTTFVALPSNLNDSIGGITTHNGMLTVTGVIHSYGHVASLNGNTWLQYGGGLSKGGSSIASVNGRLFIADGKADGLGLDETDGLNYWNGSSWQVMPGSDCYDLMAHGTTLYTLGAGPTDGQVTQLNGNTWSNVGEVGGFQQKSHPFSLGWYGSSLIIGGDFHHADDQTVNNLAAWDGSHWSRLAPGAATDDFELRAVGIYNNSLIVAGDKRLFNGTDTSTTFSTSPDGVNFSPMPGVVDGYTRGFIQYGPGKDLYTYGSIKTIDGVQTTGIARWNGASWSPLGAALLNPQFDPPTQYVSVYDAVEYNGKLICGGFFHAAGNTPMNFISAWNGASWSNLAAGTNGFVNAMAVHNGLLYAVGDFTIAGGVNVQFVAKWNGTSWSDGGSGLTDWLSDLIEFQGDLYGAKGHTIYKLVGNTWQVHSIVPNDETFSTVYQLTTYRGELCARGHLGGGDGWQGGRQVMVFHNGVWTDVHPDKHNKSTADAIEFKGQLITVGSFTAVGDVVSPTIARYKPDQPYIWDQPDDLASPCPGSTVDFQLQDIGGPILVHHWYRNNVMLVNGATGTGSTISGATSTHMQITNISSADDGLYKCEVTSQCGNATSRTVRLITFCLCGPADMGSQGGVPGPDGLLDNNDFVVFIDLFFQGNQQADVGQQGGIPGHDGMFDNNDFVVYIDMFFAGCQ